MSLLRSFRLFDNLRARIAALLILGVLFAGAGFDFLLVSVIQNRLREELSFRTRALLEHMVEQSVTALALGDSLELATEVRRFAQESDVVAAALYRADGTLAAAAVRAPGMWRKVGATEERLVADAPALRTVRAGEFDLRDHVEPVLRRTPEVGSAEGEASELFGLPDAPTALPVPAGRVGWVRLVVSTERLEQAVGDTSRLGMVILLAALGLWMVPVLSLVRLVAQPLREASELAGEIAAGQLDRRLPIRSRDELGALAESMNTMASALQDAHRLAQAEAEALRTATSAVVAIARGARLANDPDSVFALVSAEARRVTGCDAVALAVPDESEQLTFVNFDPPPPWGGLAEKSTLPPDARREWMDRVDGVLRRTLDGSGDPLAQGLAAAGFRTALSVPLIIEGRSSAMLLLAARGSQAFPESGADLVGALASHLSAALRAERLNVRLERAIQELQRTRDYMVRSEMLRVAGEMASGVAHEFNNTLGAILGRAQLLRQRALQGVLPAAELAASLQVMERAAQDGTETVRRLRQFGRGDDAVTESVDLAAAASDAVEFTRPRWENEAQTGGRTIHLELEAESGSWVSGRGHELREVFTNLILNAVDALPEGGTIRVGSKVRGGRVLAWVQDDGIGMSEEVRRRLFEPFFTTKGDGGTGLGLSLVYGILQRHGAGVRVESQPGAGTRVDLSFPLGAAAESRESGGLAIVAGGPAAQASLMVVVVDDEPAVRDLMRDIAEALGHDVRTHESGEIALAAYRPGEVDLLLTDIGMPGMSGWQLARSVRAIDPAVTICFVTGWGEEMDPVEVTKAGADHVISKPFTIEDVIQVTQVAIHLRSQRKAA